MRRHLLDLTAQEASSTRTRLEGGRALKGTGTLRVSVDSEKCQGHNRCQALAPELFEVDDLGFARAKGTGAVPAELEGKALLAVRNCPEYAVRAVREET